MQLIDIGVNLTNKRLLADADTIIDQAAEAGVSQMVITGTSITHSQRAVDLCTLHPQHLFCTAGVHPHDAKTWTGDSANELRSLLQLPVVRAVGETGLDFNRNFSPQQTQIEVFEQQMQLAVESGKPLFLHQRDAMDTFVTLLKHWRDQLGKIVAHCFTDDKRALFALLDLDCHIGITGWICDERRGADLRASVPHIPQNRLMIETDAPYLLPRDLPDAPRDKTNRPQYLPHILHTVARLRNEDAMTLAPAIHQTTRAFFAI